MSYLKDLNHEGLANILICPHCGGESFKLRMENSLRCRGCEFWFFLGPVNINFGMKANRTIHASMMPIRSKDDWDWKLEIREDSIRAWVTWDNRHEEQRTDKRLHKEVKVLMNNKWEAHKVAVALTASFKKQAAG